MAGYKKRYYDYEDSSKYFTSYEDLAVHKIMLDDEPRTAAYRKAIMNNKSYFKDKVVMDVGSGTGVLSIFCAQAGAKKVYAVEASNVARLSQRIIRDNRCDDVVEVINSKVEDVVLPNNEKVDIIISEWMGFYLLHEGMLDSVFYARDKFLKRNGQMFPESAVIYAAPCSVPSYYNKWDNYMGLNMETFAENLRVDKANTVEIMEVANKHVLAHEEALCWINLREDKVSDLESISLQHVFGADTDGYYQGVCVWFECYFPELTGGKEERVILDTSPRSPQTHWKQTVALVPSNQEIKKGQPIAMKLTLDRNKDNRRWYSLTIQMLSPDQVEHPLPCCCDLTKCILIKTFMTQQAAHVKENTTKKSVLVDDVIDDED